MREGARLFSSFTFWLDKGTLRCDNNFWSDFLHLIVLVVKVFQCQETQLSRHRNMQQEQRLLTICRTTWMVLQPCSSFAKHGLHGFNPRNLTWFTGPFFSWEVWSEHKTTLDLFPNHHYLQLSIAYSIQIQRGKAREIWSRVVGQFVTSSMCLEVNLLKAKRDLVAVLLVLTQLLPVCNRFCILWLHAGLGYWEAVQ